MAKKKIADTSDDLEQNDIIVNRETQTANEKVKKEEVVAEPSEYAKIIMAKYPNESQMYVDRLGGVYSVDTPPSLRGDAILYKNPYFKS